MQAWNPHGVFIYGGVDGTIPNHSQDLVSIAVFESAVLQDGTVTCVAGQTL
jgi:hypothetical protein